MSSASGARRPRLRRSDCSGPGFRRVRRGRGFGYLDEDGERVDDADTVARIRELAIPPAWGEVWICLDPWGHLQATGTDAAGRKQYLYHQRWREQRDRAKFREMERFAEQLPKLRRRVAADLKGDEPSRERVLACAVRLLDVGLFRIGGEEYAEQGGGLGLATIGPEHVLLHDGSAVFDYPAKSGVRRVHEVSDAAAVEVLRALARRRGGPEELLAYRERRRWRPIRSDDINDYIKDGLGPEFSAKDFRTWNGTVLGAVALAGRGTPPTSKTGARRVMNAVSKEVAEVLGNTPAVARRAYIDPRVFDRYLSGWTIRGAVDGLERIGEGDSPGRRRLERAVLDLLHEDEDSSAIKIAA
jgi:DNA topoisomerase IB